MYRRFNYFSLDKIRNFYKIITISTPVKISAEKEIYKIYTLTKITNRILKTFSKHKDQKLILIQFDITNPFLIIQGNKYFLLVINNYTRKN
jgi:hypothetical protein